MRIDYYGFPIEGTPEEMYRLIELLSEPEEATVTIEGLPEPEPEQVMKTVLKAQKAQRKSTTKKELDIGKMKALRKAGWSFQKIADEMGVASAQTIANHLKNAD